MADESAGGYPGGWWGAAGTGLGVLGDIYSFINNLKAKQQQQQLFEILSNPSKLAAYVSKYFSPMSAAENTAVQRDLGANWAVMTGGAPGGAMNQFIADALAKIESQRYQAAGDQSIAALRSAGGQIPGQSPVGLTGQILKNLLILKQLGGPKTPDATGITTPGWGGYRTGEQADPSAIFPPPGASNPAPVFPG